MENDQLITGFLFFNSYLLLHWTSRVRRPLDHLSNCFLQNSTDPALDSDSTWSKPFGIGFILNKSIREQNYKQWYSIQSEDLAIIEGMQQGRHSPIFNGGNFSPVMDNPTHHFNKWVAENLKL